MRAKLYEANRTRIENTRRDSRRMQVVYLRVYLTIVLKMLIYLWFLGWKRREIGEN
jgi:hypothetical protein